MRAVVQPQKENSGNLLHDEAIKLVEGMTTIPELKAQFSPGEIVRILSHAERISAIKPKTEEKIEETFVDDGLENPEFEIFFEENYMPLVEAQPEKIYTYLDTARRAFKEISDEKKDHSK